MAIRIQNMDLEIESMRQHVYVNLGDITATGGRTLFVAPTDCIIRRINFYPLNSASGAFNSSQCLVLTVRLANASGSSLALFNTQPSGLAQNCMTISSNNSLTMGTIVELMVSATCQTLSSVMFDVVYVPRRHRRANR